MDETFPELLAQHRVWLGFVFFFLPKGKQAAHVEEACPGVCDQLVHNSLTG